MAQDVVQSHALQGIGKSPSGIKGLDQITNGGLPRGRPTLVCGAAGSGKTLFSMEFLVRGALEYDEPGVFIAFEERPEEIARNVASLGFDLPKLEEEQKIFLDYVHVERSEFAEAGEYDLEALFIRIADAVSRVGAKRVAIDTIETLFGGLDNPAILRAELRRLFRWLKDHDLTVVITGERGDDGGSLTRQGLEEYVSDCVILLDHRVHDRVATRHLRIVKYRGSMHGSNEYPFLIHEDGFEVLPITSLGLTHAVSAERISSGVPGLDEMLGGEGFYRGSSILISGTAGTGKSSLSAHFAHAAASRGERVSYFAFEESPSQIVRNMTSIGLDLEPWLDQDLLRIHATRPTLYGLESHLAEMHKEIRLFRPQHVVIDPVSNFAEVGTIGEVRSMLMRLVDWLKVEGVTGIFTSLTAGGDALEATEMGMSSLMDAWILLRDIEHGGERNRGIYVLKSRGMSHSNQIREFTITSGGIRLTPVYVGPEGVLTGSARVAQEAREKARVIQVQQEIARRERELEVRRAAAEAQIAALRAEQELAEAEIRTALEHERAKRAQIEVDRDAMRSSRRASQSVHGNGAGGEASPRPYHHEEKHG